MLAYAASAPRFAERGRSPRALLFIVGVHIAAVGVLMTARMDVGGQSGFTRTIVDLVRIPPPGTPPPPPPRQQPVPDRQPISKIDATDSIVPIPDKGPVIDQPPIEKLPIGPTIGTGTEYVPPPIHTVVRKAARFATPDWALKPPYPYEKRQAEEEATLKLRLSIDDQGRVIAVEPVGNVDPVFLAAARKHLIARWRYKPATEDGRPVHSSTVVTLRFELEA